MGEDGATVLVAADGKTFMVPDEVLAQHEVTDPSAAAEIKKLVDGTHDGAGLRWKPVQHQGAVRVPVQRNTATAQGVHSIMSW